jgi:choline monooxygenase
MSWAPDFEIAADVAQASTPPPAFYRSDAAFAAMREAVFAKGWQWLCHATALPAPGEARPFTLLPGLLDEPILLTREWSGTLHALSNVCTHRGRVLVEAPQALESVPAPIRCPYHGRRFGCDGRMHFMPGFEGAISFPAASDHLPRLAVHEWAGQVFVALPKAQPPFDLAAALLAIEQRLAGLYPAPLAAFVPDPKRDRDFTFDAHWALYVDNYLEGLHIPFVHPGLTQTLDWQRYRYELFEGGNLQLGLAAADEPAFTPSAGSPEYGQRIGAYYFWLFPNLMLNFYPWGLSLNLVLPISTTRTRVLFRGFVADAAQLGQAQAGAGGALDAVELEDQAAILGVQRGLASRLATRGRYSPQHERGTHQFHRMLQAALRAPASMPGSQLLGPG